MPKNILAVVGAGFVAVVVISWLFWLIDVLFGVTEGRSGLDTKWEREYFLECRERMVIRHSLLAPNVVVVGKANDQGKCEPRE